MARKETFDLKRLEYWLSETERNYIEKFLCGKYQSLQSYVQSLLKAQIKQRKKRQLTIKFQNR